MSTTPPGEQPSFAEENAMRIASESLTHYDQAADTYHCSYGPPVPAVTVHDPDRDVLVRVEPASGQVVGFSIPNFKAWHAAHAEEDGTFEVELPSVWDLSTGEALDQD
ncbi:MAG: hypothetical protein IT200_07575 [Thermoleophilia bacterium]|nr:hypothetical protein [Thermoleophilia bacterium]